MYAQSLCAGIRAIGGSSNTLCALIATVIVKTIIAMEKFPTFQASEGPVRAWLTQFNLHYRLFGCKPEEKAALCQSVVGPLGQEVNERLAADPSYEDVQDTLIAANGMKDETKEA